jgi:VWFA-related protein
MMRLLRASIACALAIASTVAPAAQQQQVQPQPDVPVFRSSVEVTSLDVGAFDSNGRPVTDLKADDFSVRIDGADRRVITAEWVSLETEERPPAPPAPEGYSGNENATGGRLIALVIDQANIRLGGTLAIRGAVNAFIDHLKPSDRAAVLGIGQGAVSTPFTADRARLKRAVERLVGEFQSTSSLSAVFVSIAEAMDIRRDRPGVFEQVVLRECAGMSQLAFESCQVEVGMEAQHKSSIRAADGQRTISVMRSLLKALRSIDAPKSLIFISEGFIVDEQRQSVIELGALAAAARTSIYTLKLDDQLFMAMAENGRAPLFNMDDRWVSQEGLQLLAGASRGALFNVLGTGSGVFERVESELSGYYLLGVESIPSDRDGRSHSVRLDVKRKGLTIRSRPAFMATEGQPKTTRQAVIEAVESPLPVAALPLRVATFSLQGPENGRVQLLIHADVGSDYSTQRPTTIGYTISDREGNVVERQLLDARLPPVMTGVPSALQFTGGASVPPGEYTLKFAVAEGDRIGTVEHEFHADVLDAAPMKVSDLMVGGPVNGNIELLQPTVGFTVVFGMVHGYVEAYGDDAAAVKATFELAASDSGEALLSRDVPVFKAGPTRTIFSATLPVRQLPPGVYRLRSTITGPQGVVKKLTRAFEVATPAVLMTSAEAGDVLTTADVFLPISDSVLAREFRKDDVTKRETLQVFRPRVAVSARTAFDAGVSALASGDFGKAETSFKSALGTDAENTTVLAYLAAVFAAAGRDDQAAGAWQTALVDGSDLPQIYEWLADSLMRLRRLAEARGVLEEATAKWPADGRFARPLAMVYATFGRGPQATRLLERYLEEHPADVDALQLGVEWLYHLKLARAAAQSPSDDVKQARLYADAYMKAKGPQQALVRQWMAFLEK